MLVKIIPVLFPLLIVSAVGGAVFIGADTSVTSTEVVHEEPVEKREVRLVVVPTAHAASLATVESEEESLSVVPPLALDVTPEASEPIELVSDEVTELVEVDQTEIVVPEVVEAVVATELSTTDLTEGGEVVTVPFYSQFADISSASWQKVGCGIASLAMLIEYYTDESVSVDGLLQKGIAANAFLHNAGWIHAGLIGLSRPYGLGGDSHSLAHLSMDSAFAEFTEVLEEGPVMASVHYTFEPTNPIPHLVVINDVQDGLVYYNDPAEEMGGGSLSIEKFQRAWKKRYISIRPTS